MEAMDENDGDIKLVPDIKLLSSDIVDFDALSECETVDQIAKFWRCTTKKIREHVKATYKEADVVVRRQILELRMIMHPKFQSKMEELYTTYKKDMFSLECILSLFRREQRLLPVICLIAECVDADLSALDDDYIDKLDPYYIELLCFLLRNENFFVRPIYTNNTFEGFVHSWNTAMANKSPSFKQAYVRASAGNLTLIINSLRDSPGQLAYLYVLLANDCEDLLIVQDLKKICAESLLNDRQNSGNGTRKIIIVPRDKKKALQLKEGSDNSYHEVKKEIDELVIEGLPEKQDFVPFNPENGDLETFNVIDSSQANEDYDEQKSGFSLSQRVAEKKPVIEEKQLNIKISYMMVLGGVVVGVALSALYQYFFSKSTDGDDAESKDEQNALGYGDDQPALVAAI